MFLRSIYTLFGSKIKIPHENLLVVKSYQFDEWNKIEKGQARLDVFIRNNHLGFVEFRNLTGQICLIDVNEKYRRQGIANFMLSHVEKELVNNNVMKMWAVCTQNHYFWSKQKNYIFDNRPHISVTGFGYFKKLN